MPTARDTAYYEDRMTAGDHIDRDSDAYKLGVAEQEIKQLRAALLKIDQTALAAAAKKLRRLRLEDVGGRKERPAETVGSAMDKVFNGLGSTEGQEYVLRHGLKYYFEALAENKS